jgi:hypothetical protein
MFKPDASRTSSKSSRTESSGALMEKVVPVKSVQQTTAQRDEAIRLREFAVLMFICRSAPAACQAG